jgi:hypothetical protein
MAVRLSKSKLMAALQCDRRLWLEVHHPEFAELSAATRAAFATGHDVGEVARALYSARFGDGPTIGYEGGLGQALAATKRLLADPEDRRPVYEATFQHKGILVRLDVLLREPSGMRLIEVKSSTSLKPEHVTDCAIQAWVARGAGLDLERVSLAHIDSHFVYPGGGDYQGLLLEHDISSEVMARQAEVPRWLAAAQKVGACRAEPEVQPGKRCVTPYECAFMAHCWPGDAAYPVQALGGDRELLGRYVAAGYRDLRDIPTEQLTRADHVRIQAITRAGVPQLAPEAGRFVDELAYPRYYLDFETIAPAVPVFPGTRPYQTLPFQFSCHVVQADGHTEHRSHLDLSGGEPSRQCAEALLAALGTAGPVVVYTSYEARVIDGLAERFPDLAMPLRALNERLVDLHPLAKKYFYHPDMLGSWSLKKLLPVIAPELDYTSGEVQDGNAASAAWLEAQQPETSPARRAALAAELERYCALDTEGLIRITHHFSSSLDLV